MFGIGRRKRDPAADADRTELHPPLPDGGAMKMIFERLPERKLDLIERKALCPPLWRLVEQDGPLVVDRLRLLPDGRVLGGDPATWALTDGALHFTAASGEIAVAFRTVEQRLGLTELAGDILTGADPVPCRLVPNHDDLRTTATIGVSRHDLIASFGAGAEAASSGDATVCDRLADAAAAHFGTDRVTFLETAAPDFMFVNKTARVVEILKGLVLPGVSRVVMVGYGPGGFAALMFGELLAAALPDRDIRTLTVNALVDVDPAHFERSRGDTPDTFWPPMIEPDALAQRDTWFGDVVKIRETIRKKQGRIAHTLLFDEGNPCAAHQAGLIGAFEGTERKGFALGLPYAEGARAIIDSGDAGAELARLLG